MSIAQVNVGMEQALQTVFANDTLALQAFREKAWRAFQELPDHHFERSNFDDKLYDFTPKHAEGLGEWKNAVERFIDLDSDNPVLVFVDDVLVFTGGLDNLNQGIVVQPLRDAAQHPDILQKIGTVVAVDENKWIALQSAFWHNGVYIHVPKNTTVDGVLQIVHLTTEPGRGAFPRNLIVAETGSKLSLLDLYIANEEIEQELNFGVTEIIAAAGSHVNLGAISNLPKKTTSYWVRRAKVERDAHVDFIVGEMGDGYTVGEFGSLLLGDGSASNGYAFALGTGKAHMDLTAKMVHVGKFSQSDTSARGVMQGRAVGIYRGVTHIQKGASGAVGEQAEKLLMLSPKSRADAIPTLLIDENDVKCGHAASVGQISEEQLFYLMSRGITDADAKRMIVWGFLAPVLAAVPVEHVRQAIIQLLERKMS